MLATYTLYLFVWTINEPHVPKKNRPSCYAKSPTVQDKFWPLTKFILLLIRYCLPYKRRFIDCIILNTKEWATRLRANSVKFETGWDLLLELKIVTHTALLLHRHKPLFLSMWPVALFLVWFNNFDQTTRELHSYSNHPPPPPFIRSW